MANTQDEKYAEARMALESAIEDYWKAAGDIGLGAQQIADDVGDALYNATDGAAKYDSTTLE